MTDSSFFGPRSRTVRVRDYTPLDHFGRPEFNVTRAAEMTAGSMPPGALAALVLVGFVFAAGLFGGMLLFGHRAQDPPLVITCPAPGVQVAALPVECNRLSSTSGPAARVVAR